MHLFLLIVAVADADADANGDGVAYQKKKIAPNFFFNLKFCFLEFIGFVFNNKKNIQKCLNNGNTTHTHTHPNTHTHQ